jgi:hypothetical protein
MLLYVVAVGPGCAVATLGCGAEPPSGVVNPLVVRLGPTGALTGRIVDMDGQPVRGATVAAVYSGQVGRDLAKELQRRDDLPRTDDNGYFRLGAIVPGLKFELAVAKGQQRLDPEPRMQVKPLEAGQRLGLGEIRVKSSP